ncbi:hypothetical protein LJC74_05405 [Eubacteriales bacterium OttesenSCG-928-A19]|nr:hypothetical protein [Eubacteriales bacterium OttesenSCG-928-A19]
MAFEKDVPDYRSIKSEKYSMDGKNLNKRFWDNLEAYANDAVKETGDIDVILEELLSLASLPPSKNWTYEYKQAEIGSAIREIKHLTNTESIAPLMDTIPTATSLSISMVTLAR